MKPRTQLRWWKPGGFRLPILARLTNGRLGLGRWTQEEIDEVKKEAHEVYEKLKDCWE